MTITIKHSVRQPFVRNRFTWFLYMLLACYSYLQVTPGAVIPFLHTELHLDYTLDSLHLSSMSIGAILAGLVSMMLVARLRRRGVIWFGGIGMLSGVLLLLISHTVIFSITSMFLMGFFGSLMMICAQSALSDHYSEQRATALTEANTATSLAASLAPVCLGGMLLLGIGWRSMLVVPVLGVLLLVFFFRKVEIPESKPVVQNLSTRAGAPNRSSTAFWLYWSLLVLVVSIEWGISFWGAGFLIHVVGLERNLAASMMSLFFLAEVCARLGGSWLTRRFSAERLLSASLCIVCAGFLLFWLSPWPGLTIAGLIIAGLGVANLFPLSFSMSVQQIPQYADIASARGALGGGVAIAAAPFILGYVADLVGLQRAYTLILVLIVLAGGTLLLANRFVHSHKDRLAMTLADIALGADETEVAASA